MHTLPDTHEPSDLPDQHSTSQNNLLKNNSTLEAANPGRRIVALILDTLLFVLVLAVVAGISGIDFLTGWGLIATTILYWLALSLPQATWRKTPGKAVLGLVVQSRTGQTLTPGLALLRNAWVLAGLLPVIGDGVEVLLALTIVVSMFVGNSSQGLHDRLADAQVLRARSTHSSR